MISKLHGTFILSLMAVVPANVAAETFVYSGGCFWCTEADTEKLEGVSDVISGFTGGTTANPVYRVGKWGDHREAAQVIYDPAVISFNELVTMFMKPLIMKTVTANFAIGVGHIRQQFIIKARQKNLP